MKKILFLMLFCNMVMAQSQQRIINGTVSEAKPWMVSLQWGGRHFCGGVLVHTKKRRTSRTILTAHHCVEGIAPNEPSFTVSIGIQNIKDPQRKRFSVKEIRKYPSYVGAGFVQIGKLAGDLAVLKLRERVVLPRNSRIFLPSPESYNPTKKGKIYGWGATDPQGSQYPNTLQKATVALQTAQTCLKVMGIREEDGEICAGILGSPGVDSCYGDSGGPLLIGRRVHGLTSWGIGCAGPRYYGVYTRVDKYIEWINKR